MFQTIAIELYKQPKKYNEEKGHVRLVIGSIDVGVVAKTDEEIYVLSTVKIYCYFSLVFSIALKKVELLKISKMMQLHCKSLPLCNYVREENNKFVGSAHILPCCFPEKK